MNNQQTEEFLMNRAGMFLGVLGINVDTSVDSNGRLTPEGLSDLANKTVVYLEKSGFDLSGIKIRQEDINDLASNRGISPEAAKNVLTIKKFMSGENGFNINKHLNPGQAPIAAGVGSLSTIMKQMAEMSKSNIEDQTKDTTGPNLPTPRNNGEAQVQKLLRLYLNNGFQKQ